jgi:hypothetical protein
MLAVLVVVVGFIHGRIVSLSGIHRHKKERDATEALHRAMKPAGRTAAGGESCLHDRLPDTLAQRLLTPSVLVERMEVAELSDAREVFFEQYQLPFLGFAAVGFDADMIAVVSFLVSPRALREQNAIKVLAESLHFLEVLQSAALAAFKILTPHTSFATPEKLQPDVRWKHEAHNRFSARPRG